MINRKSQRDSIDLSKTRRLINTGDYLSVSNRNINRFVNWKCLGSLEVLVKFSPLEDFLTEEEKEKERVLCFEENCTKINADCYVPGDSRTKFPLDEKYHVVFFKYW